MEHTKGNPETEVTSSTQGTRRKQTKPKHNIEN